MELLVMVFAVFVVCALAYWCVHRIAEGFNLPGPLLAIADVLIVGLGVFWLLRASGLLARAGL